ncbi:MAG: ABC transporter substrate-binding protein [Sulfurimonadaceae bacterium]
MRYNSFLTILTLLAFIGFTQPLMADDKTDIKASMTKTIGEITSLIQDKSLAKEARNSQVEVIIKPLFDFGLMGRLSLGKEQWKKLTPEERKTFSELFEERVKQSYMSKLDLYTDEVVIIDDAVQVKSRIHLATHLIRKNERRDILYKFYKSKERGWLIYDVDILGVSIIQTYRTQFAGILKEGSFATLIEKLEISES